QPYRRPPAGGANSSRPNGGATQVSSRVTVAESTANTPAPGPTACRRTVVSRWHQTASVASAPPLVSTARPKGRDGVRPPHRNGLVIIVTGVPSAEVTKPSRPAIQSTYPAPYGRPSDLQVP